MVEKVTTMELDRMMDRMFSVDPKDYSFFRKYMDELTQTDEGSHLLRSLDEKFNGKKIALRSQTYAEMKKKGGSYGGYFSANNSELVVVTGSKLENDSRIAAILYHELTHFDQHLNRGNSGRTITKSDAYFAAWMEEADARVSTFFFAKEWASQGNLWQRHLHRKGLQSEIRLHDYAEPELYVRQAKDFLQGRHSDWSDDQVQKETKKMLLISILRETNLDSYWHRYYDKEYTRDVEPAGRPPNGYGNTINSGAPLVEVMSYYSEKYGLTPHDCLELQQEVLSKSGISLPRQERRQVDENTTDVYLDGELSHRVVKKADETEVMYSEGSSAPHVKCILKKDGSTVSLVQDGSFETVSEYDKFGRVVFRENKNSQNNSLNKMKWRYDGEGPSFEEAAFKDGKLQTSNQRFGQGFVDIDHVRNTKRIGVYNDYALKMGITEGDVYFDKEGQASYVFNYINEFRSVDGQFVKIETDPETLSEKAVPATPKEIRDLHELDVLAKEIDQLSRKFPNTLIGENTEQSAPVRDTPVQAPHQTNMQLLAQASISREQPTAATVDTPNISKTSHSKLDPAILSHLSHGGNGG